MFNIGFSNKKSKKELCDENADLHVRAQHHADNAVKLRHALVETQEEKDRYKKQAENLHQQLGDLQARYQYEEEVHKEQVNFLENTIIKLADRIIGLQNQLAEESEENEQKGEESCHRQVVEQENDELKRRIEDLEKKLAGERQINANQADKIEQLQNRNQNQVGQILNCKKEVRKLRDENTNLQGENQAFKEEVKIQVEKVEELRNDVKDTQRELQEVYKALQEEREKNRSPDNKILCEIIEQKNHSIDEYCKQIKGLKNNIEKFKQQVKDNEHIIRAKNTKLENFQARINHLEAKDKTLQGRIRYLEGKLIEQGVEVRQ